MLHDINQDLQIVNSEEINPRESTNEHPVAAQYVKEMYKCKVGEITDKKCKKQTKQIEDLKSGNESALNKETEQYRGRILSLEKILERDKTLYLLFNKIQSQEIQNLSYDERLPWLQTQSIKQ